MNNLDKPAYPHNPIKPRNNNDEYGYSGLTKREMFCLELGVPDTGDKELDEIIHKANFNKAAMAAMQGILANPTMLHSHDKESQKWCAVHAVQQADELLKQLENENNIK